MCALGACRSECTTSADCGGGSCVSSGTQAVCQAEAEKNAPCDGPSACPAPLVCASDYRCRNACFEAADCNVLGMRGRVCARDALGAQFCADPAEVGDGLLRAAPPEGAPEAESTTLPAGLGTARASFVGPEGGSLGLGTLLLTVPPGAVPRALPFTIVEVPAPAVGALGRAYALGPVGVVFDEPVRIRMRVPSSGVAGTDLTIATYRSGELTALEGVARDDADSALSGTARGLGLFLLVSSDLGAAASVPAAQVVSTGAPCAEAGDCLGGAPMCLTAGSTSALSYPGGYCSAGCTADADCNAAGGSEHGCPFARNASGLAPALCHQRCTGDDDCRAGYACLSFRALYIAYGLPEVLLGGDADDETYCVGRPPTRGGTAVSDAGLGGVTFADAGVPGGTGAASDAGLSSDAGVGTALAIEELCAARYRVALAWRDTFAATCATAAQDAAARAEFLRTHLDFEETSIDTCVSGTAALVDGGALTYEPSAAQACADAYSAQFVAPLSSYGPEGIDIGGWGANLGHGAAAAIQLPQCRAALVGRRGLGAACTSSAACVDGLRCLGLAVGSGTCQPAVALGGACTSTGDCGDDGRCVRNSTASTAKVCISTDSLHATGQACDSDVECASGLACSSANQCESARSIFVCSAG